jgi:hypothetical protein
LLRSHHLASVLLNAPSLLLLNHSIRGKQEWQADGGCNKCSFHSQGLFHTGERKKIAGTVDLNSFHVFLSLAYERRLWNAFTTERRLSSNDVQRSVTLWRRNFLLYFSTPCI